MGSDRLVGSTVRVEWLGKSGEFPWTLYRIDGMDGDWLLMQGLDDARQDARFTGGPIWVHARTIDCMEVERGK